MILRAQYYSERIGSLLLRIETRKNPIYQEKSIVYGLKFTDKMG